MLEAVGHPVAAPARALRGPRPRPAAPRRLARADARRGPGAPTGGLVAPGLRPARGARTTRSAGRSSPRGAGRRSGFWATTCPPARSTGPRRRSPRAAPTRARPRPRRAAGPRRSARRPAAALRHRDRHRRAGLGLRAGVRLLRDDGAFLALGEDLARRDLEPGVDESVARLGLGQADRVRDGRRLGAAGDLQAHGRALLGLGACCGILRVDGAPRAHRSARS